MDKNDPRREPTEEELDSLNEHWEEPGDPDGVFAEEERQKLRVIPPRGVPAPVQKKKHRIAKVLIGLVLLAAATAGAYWIGNHQGSAPSPTSTTQTPATTTKPKTTPKTTTTPIKHYDSTNFTLGLDYPTTWTLTDTATKLTVASPSTDLMTAKGKTTGHVLVTFLKKQTTIAGFPADGAVSALASQKLTYKQPTTIQRAQTYISFLGYTQLSGLDAIYVTGDSGYLQNQLVPMSDVVVGDPLVSVTFVTCAADDCAGGVTPLTLQASSWQTAAFNKQITDLLQSIQLD